MSLLGNAVFIEILKNIIFIGLFLFSTTFLIPKGIISLRKWKDKNDAKDLKVSINALAAAFFILALLLYYYIFGKWSL